MVNIQEWLEKTYSDKTTTTKIDLNLLKEDITGTYSKLVIDSYFNLTSINSSSYKNIQKLILSNLPNLTKITWTKSEVTSLDLLNCPKLEFIDFSNNLLTEINLLLDTRKLKNLYLNNNNFPKQDLSIFKSLVNLEELSIGNYRETDLRKISIGKSSGDKKIKRGIYNRFYGSLEPLKDLTSLNLLEINNTDIDSGLEYLRLDDNGQVIVYCLAQERPDCRVKTIWEKLNPYTGDVQAWKRDNLDLTANFIIAPKDK